MSDTGIIAHNWNGFQIHQASEEFRIGQHTVPVGSVNLTDICKVAGKDAYEFLRLPSTQAYCKAYESKTAKIAVMTSKGQHGGTWGVLPLALKMLSWIDVEFEVWGSEVLTKAVTGQEITNNDRAEGWAKASQLGLNLEVKRETRSIDNRKDFERQLLKAERFIVLSKKHNVPIDVVATAFNFAAKLDSSDDVFSVDPDQDSPSISGDLIKQFVADCIVITGDVDKITMKRAMYDRYVQWCKPQDLRPRSFGGFCYALTQHIPDRLHLDKTTNRVNGKTVAVPARYHSIELR